MDYNLLMITVEIVITAILSVEVYKLHCLSKSGAFASLVVGVLLAIFGSVNAYFIMTFFVIVSFFATMKDIDKKIEMGFQEGQFGERGWKNVSAVAFPPILFTMLHYFGVIDYGLYMIMFLTSVVVAASDTVASEIGVKDPKTYLITTLKPVPAGTNGGVSKRGTIVSIIAALATAVIGWIAMNANISVYVLIPFLFGVFGNLLDSVFGTLLEDRGYISKFTNNWSTELIAGLLAGGVWLLILG